MAAILKIAGCPCFTLLQSCYHNSFDIEEHSDSVVEYLTGDRGVAGLEAH